jgi:hypothetical protein
VPLKAKYQKQTQTRVKNKDNNGQEQLDELIDALKKVLGNYTVWHGYETESNNAPSPRCSRLQFIQQVFAGEPAGLIICYPEQWLRCRCTVQKRRH